MPNSTQGGPHEEAPPFTHRELPDWEGIRVFLAVARHRSLRSAAVELRQSTNIVRRRLAKFETQIGAKLAIRHANGVKLTTEGERIVTIAARMEDMSFDLIHARDRTGGAHSGQIRLAATEGLGSWWIAPRLIEMRRAYPDLLIDLHCTMQTSAVVRLEADLAVQIVPPENNDLERIKLGRLHGMAFASKSYVEARGVPKNDTDLENHDLVLQVSEQVASVEYYDRLFRDGPSIRYQAVRTNTSSAQCHAIASGAGIGLLPTYAVAIGLPVVPVDLSYRIAQDIWLVYRPSAQNIPRVRVMIDWLVDAFSPKRFPWFGDEFIHPKDLPQSLEGPSGRPQTAPL